MSENHMIIDCTTCGQRLLLPPDYEEKTCRCPSCGTIVHEADLVLYEAEPVDLEAMPTLEKEAEVEAKRGGPLRTIATLVAAVAIAAAVLVPTYYFLTRPNLLDGELLRIRREQEIVRMSDFHPEPPFENAMNAGAIYESIKNDLPLLDAYLAHITLEKPIAEWTADDTAYVRNGIEERRDTLQKILEAVDAPYTDFVSANYSRAFHTDLGHLPAMREAAGLLAACTSLALREGEPDYALMLCGSIFEMANQLERESLLVSQMTRMSIAAVGYERAQTIFPLNDPSQEDLELFLDILGESVQREAFTRALEGERYIFFYVLWAAEQGLLDYDALTEDPEQLALLRPPSAPWKRMSYEHELRQYSGVLSRLITFSKKPLYEIQGDLDAIARNVRPGIFNPTGGVSAAVIPGMLKTFPAQARHEARVQMLRLYVALILYRRANGAYPVALDDLAPQFIDESPLDPFTGTPFRYEPRADGFTIEGASGRERDAAPFRLQMNR